MSTRRTHSLLHAFAVIIAAQSGLQAATLPFEQNLDALDSGPIAATAGFTLAQGQADIIEPGLGLTQGGKALRLAAGSQLGLTLEPAGTPAAVQWVDVKVSPFATPSRTQWVDADGALIAFVREGATGRFYAYDGKTGQANASGKWVPLGAEVTLGETGYAAAPVRVTLRINYATKRFDVLLDGALRQANLGLDSSATATPTALDFYAESSALTLDDISFGPTLPAGLPADSDGDGMSDAYESAHGLNPNDASDRDGDKDLDGLSNITEATLGLDANNPADALTQLGVAEIPGLMLREVWENIAGQQVGTLRAATRDLQTTPTRRLFMAGTGAPANWGNQYGQRIRGFLTIPATGAYRLAISGDNSAELRISPDGRKFGKAKVAAVPGSGYSNPNQWTKFPDQISQVYDLTAGQRVYIEIIHKESTGADHLQLGWIRPGEATASAVPAASISSYTLDANDKDDDDLPDDWEVAHGLSSTDRTGVNGKHGDKDGDGLANALELARGTNPAVSDAAALAGKVEVPGVFQREVWTGTGLGSSSVDASMLRSRNIVTRTPNNILFSTADMPANIGDNYAVRSRAWITVPATADYTFAIASDDGGELYLSADEAPENARRIGGVSGWTGRMTFGNANQIAKPIRLEAGKRYYVESLFAEWGGADHQELAWLNPDSAAWEVIPSDWLTSYVVPSSLDNQGLPKSWLDSNGLSALSAEARAPWADADADGVSNLDEYLAGLNPLSPTTRGFADKYAHPGALYREFWYGAGNLDWSAAQAKFATAPNRVEYSRGGTENFTFSLGENYLDRSRGFVTVTTEGDYLFAVSGDDNAQLLLSTDDSPLNAIRVADIRNGSAWKQYDLELNQRSRAIHLKPGVRYYIELRHKEISGADYVSLVWKTPGATDFVAIPASALISWQPAADDADADGLPDAWAQSTGLAGRPAAERAPTADPDGDGLTNADEARLGTNALLADTDGDGVSDGEEVLLAHTNPMVTDFDGTVTSVSSVAGSAFTTTRGDWQIAGDSVHANSLRGSLAYDLTFPESMPYRLLVRGGQELSGSPVTRLSFTATVDGISLGAYTLDTAKGSTSVWLPALTAGTHRVEITWINGYSGSSLRLDGLALEKLGGTDANGDGVSDWQAARAASLTTLPSLALTSFVSPLCLEGAATDVTLSQIGTDYTPADSATGDYEVAARTLLPVQSKQAFQGKFYADIPLNPQGPTHVTLADSGTAGTAASDITWTPYDVVAHAGESLLLRAGDSLLLGGATESRQVELLSASGTVLTSYQVDAGLRIPVRFALPGSYRLRVATLIVTVEVRAAELGGIPSEVVGFARTWVPPLLPAEVTVMPEIGLSLFETSGASPRAFRLGSDVDSPRTLLARLGSESGPILDTTTTNPIVSYGNPSQKWDVVNTLPDGTQVWRGSLNFGGSIPADFRAVISIFKAGVTFTDGTINRTVTTADLDANGIFTYYLLRPPGTSGSVCHHIDLYQGATNLGRPY